MPMRGTAAGTYFNVRRRESSIFSLQVEGDQTCIQLMKTPIGVISSVAFGAKTPLT